MQGPFTITVEDLQRVDDDEEAPIPFYVTDHEKKVLTRYREKPEMKPAIDALLGIEADK